MSQPPPPLSGYRLVVTTVALSLGTFMNVLDTTIANVSIPAISGDLGVSPSQGTWVITSFAVANAIAVPLTGWLSTRFGSVRLFVTAVLLFVLASLLCALAPSMPLLVTARVIQGAVAGPMIPLSQALLLQSYPREKYAMALAAWSMTTLVAPVLGPILGGVLTDNLSWPWIFYINVPVGLLAAGLSWNMLKHRESPTKRLPIDAVGLGLLVLWVGSLQIMLDKGRELDWFQSQEIILLGVVALVGFCFFLAWELTAQHPIVDLTLFMGRNFSVGTLSVSLGYLLFFGNVVLMPLWLQQYLGYTATMAGLVTAPIGLLALLLSPVVGRIMPYTDPRRLATIAFLVFAFVSYMRAGFYLQVDVSTVVLPQVIQGIAMATFFIPLVGLSLSGLDHSRIPSASGLTNFARITAGAFGASLTTTLWDNRAGLHHAQLTEHITVYSPATAHTLGVLGRVGLDHGQSLALIERQINSQAYMLAANDIFMLSAWLFLLLTGVVWLARPVHHGGPAAPVAAGD